MSYHITTAAAALFILRNPFQIWSYGGWTAASWAAGLYGLRGLRRGAPAILEEWCAAHEDGTFWD